MLTTTDQLFQTFQQLAEYQILHKGELRREATDELVSFLTPVHCYTVHLISDQENAYLNSLEATQLSDLLQKIADNRGQFLIFSSHSTIPSACFQQKQLTLIRYSGDPSCFNPTQITQQISCQNNPLEIQGAFVVVNNQGLLLRGPSNIGKSLTLCKLVERGHAWVSDELTVLSHTSHNVIQASSCTTLEGFIHIKGIGPVNLDSLYGKAQRLPAFPLAGIIELREDIQKNQEDVDAYTQQTRTVFFNRSFPTWILKNNQDLCQRIEICARLLTLYQWGDQPAEALDTELRALLDNNKRKTCETIHH